MFDVFSNGFPPGQEWGKRGKTIFDGNSQVGFTRRHVSHGSLLCTLFSAESTSVRVESQGLKTVAVSSLVYWGEKLDLIREIS